MNFWNYRLFEYFKKNASTEDERLALDYVEYSIDLSIFNIGDNFKGTNKKSKLKFFISCIIYFGVFILSVFMPKHSGRGQSSVRGISQAVFNYDSLICNQEIDVNRIFWAPKKGSRSVLSVKTYFMYCLIKYRLSFRKGQYITCVENLKLISLFKQELERLVKKENFSFLFVSEDMSFESRILIDVFKAIGKPSFLLSHGGIHSFYGKGMDCRTDFVGQWGKIQIDGFIRHGYKKSRFLNIGHPHYRTIPTKLRFSLDNILVLTRSIQGTSLLGSPHMEDRGKAITYLLKIKDVLTSLGVQQVRLRPHPSENADWYMSFFSDKFFTIDSDTLDLSLAKSSLVVGPISTVIIDSICNGVNYTLFEPVESGKNILGCVTASPLDTLGDGFPWAKSTEDLSRLIQHRLAISTNVAQNICKVPFDSSELRSIILDSAH